MAQYNLYQNIPLNEVSVPYDHKQHILDLVCGLLAILVIMAPTSGLLHLRLVYSYYPNRPE